MRKEVILAVIIGIILGVVVLYGINLANNSSSNIVEDNQSTPSSVKVTPTPTPTTSNQVSISFPQNHAVISDKSITLKGSAKPNTNIAIISENDDILLVSDANGGFSSVINLSDGENIVTVTSLDDKQKLTETKLSIIYTATIPE